MTIILSIVFFLLGAILASFCGVVAFRVPQGMSIVKPDSFCPSCKTPIKWYDNIPIVSYLVLRGKCRTCKAKIGIGSFLFECFGALSFLGAYLMNQENYLLLALSFLLIALGMIIAIEDAASHEIMTLFLVLFGVGVVGYLTAYFFQQWSFDYWYLIGGAAGFLSFFAIHLFCKYALKKDALGMGDVYLLGELGLLVGLKKLLIVILVASLVGSIVELIKIAATKKKGEIAFGPYLLLGGYVALVFGDWMINTLMEAIGHAVL